MRIAFVSAPGGSAFMEELLSAVAAAVSATGTESFCHRGPPLGSSGPHTRFVVIPHEYFAYAPVEPATLYASTIGFGVEHPGNPEFASALRESERLGAQFQISRDAVAEIDRRWWTAHHFTLGYVRQWDRWHGQEEDRQVDIVYLGTADERRVALLSTYVDAYGPQLRTAATPSRAHDGGAAHFLLSEAKWQLLARSKVLINLHREEKTAFEWVRCLEAMANGCVVVTEPSSDLGPLKPGQHLLVAEPARLAAVALALIRLPSLRQAIANRAYDLCRSELEMSESARLLSQVAGSLPASGEHFVKGSPLPSQTAPFGEKEPPMALWVPGLRTFLKLVGRRPAPAILQQLEELSELRSSRAVVSTVRLNGPPVDVDVVCVRRPGDGPLGVTVDSLSGDQGAVGLHLAMSPAAALEESAMPRGARTFLTVDLEMGRARQRNILVKNSDSEFLCFLNAGDAILGATLQKLVAIMKADPALDIAFAMATCGPNRMTNVLIPEQRRLLTLGLS